MREEVLENIRVLELGTSCRPLTLMLAVTRMSNIHGVVHDTHLVVSRLVFERIAVLLAELGDEVNHLLSDVGELDRVGLNMDDSPSLLLTSIFQIDHEQGSALGNDVVNIARIPKRILKRCSR